MGDQLSEQFASHQPFLETRRTQASEQVEIAEVGDLADKGMQITGKGHPASPGTSNGEVLQEREEFKCVRTVGLDAILVGRIGRVQLPVSADDDLAAAGLPPIEVAGEALALVMGEFEWRLLVAVGMAVPVEMRLERSDAVKDAGRHACSGPHLATHGVYGDGEAQHGTLKSGTTARLLTQAYSL